MTLQEFINQNSITIKAERVPENPHNTDWKNADHYFCTLSRVTSPLFAPITTKKMTLYFSQGYGHRREFPEGHFLPPMSPKLTSVLECLQSDSYCIQSYDLDEWLKEMGFEDTRKNIRLYDTVKEQDKKLQAFFGPDLYHQFLHEVDSNG